MSTLTTEDINYLTHQSGEQINMILSGMTALMNDTDEKVASMESQNWFQRMTKTIFGKNKATKEEIQKNHERLNTYMSEAISELYKRGCIDQKIMISLGTQINEIYMEHVQLKQMLGAFVNKLNEKIVSIDNFHMLAVEIEQGIYNGENKFLSMCNILTQFDGRILADERKLNILKRGMLAQNIINDEKIRLTDWLKSVIDMPMADAGRIYLELSTIRDDFIAKVMLNMMENYYFLPDMARKLKNKNKLIEETIQREGLAGEVTLSSIEIYDAFVTSKIEANDTIDLAMKNQIPGETLKNEASVENAASDDSQETDYKDEKADEYDADAGECDDETSECDEEADEWDEESTGDEENKFEEYLQEAENGDVISQIYAGICYFTGNGVERDLLEGLEWFNTAEKQQIELDAMIRIACTFFDVNYDIFADTDEFVSELEANSSRIKRKIGEVYLAHGSIESWSGESIFAITEKGIYSKVFKEDFAEFIPYKKLSRVNNIDYRGNEIYADDMRIAYISEQGQEKNILNQLFWIIITLVSPTYRVNLLDEMK